MGKGFKYAALSIVILLAIAAGTVWWGYAHLTGLLQGQLRKIAGDDLSIGKVIAHWDRIELEKVVLLRHGNRPFGKRLYVERIELNPRLKSLLSGRLELGAIQIVSPYLLLEIAPDGSVVKPDLKRQKAGVGKEEGKPLPVVIDGIVINGGRMEILDWCAGRKKVVGLSNPKERYHLLRFSEIAFELGRVQFPTLDEPTPLRLSLKDEGGGFLTMDGMVSTRGGDCNLKLDMKGLKIIHYRPYFMKEGDLGITSGEAAVASNISVTRRQLRAPGTVTLKGLAFDDSGSKGILMGLPAKALIRFMADNNGELKVNFAMNGSLDNPRFTVRDSFAHEVASAISRKLGITTPAGVGEGIIGGFGTRVIRGVMNAFGGK